MWQSRETFIRSLYNNCNKHAVLLTTFNSCSEHLFFPARFCYESLHFSAAHFVCLILQRVIWCRFICTRECSTLMILMSESLAGIDTMEKGNGSRLPCLINCLMSIWMWTCFWIKFIVRVKWVLFFAKYSVFWATKQYYVVQFVRKNGPVLNDRSIWTYPKSIEVLQISGGFSLTVR